MKRKKTAYELSQSQVATPASAVALSWALSQKRRTHIGRVLDLGAGDCRFARGGTFDEYLGIEIDPSKTTNVSLPQNARVINECAFEHHSIATVIYIYIF
jgi:predicted RNA methylase